jgi:dTDP-4-amino-4,6-dideoxygalactose transaminase
VRVSVPLLDLTEQYAVLSEDLKGAIDRVIASQRFILGPEVDALEGEIAARVGSPHAIACASGTDALLLPLMALGLPRDSEVVVPAFTFFATAGAVWNAGLRPVFCDVDPVTFNMVAATAEMAWTARTRALIPVHLFGQMAPMGDLVALARKTGAFVLEDAAQAIGASLEGVMAGAAGNAGAFSFFPTKNLGGFGDGGMITTADPLLAERIRKMRVHGGATLYRHDMVGTNSRLDALQAAILRVKLPHLETWTAARQANAALYDELLSDVAEVVTPAVSTGNIHVYNQYTLRVRRRDALREFLDSRGIGSGVYYPIPLHLQECFKSLGHGPGDFPVSERLSEEVISLPIYPELGSRRIEAVVAAIRDFYDS